jgi:hypothetical protein
MFALNEPSAWHSKAQVDAEIKQRGCAFRYLLLDSEYTKIANAHSIKEQN